MATISTTHNNTLSTSTEQPWKQWSNNNKSSEISEKPAQFLWWLNRLENVWKGFSFNTLQTQAWNSAPLNSSPPTKHTSKNLMFASFVRRWRVTTKQPPSWPGIRSVRCWSYCIFMQIHWNFDNWYVWCTCQITIGITISIYTSPWNDTPTLCIDSYSSFFSFIPLFAYSSTRVHLNFNFFFLANRIFFSFITFCGDEKICMVHAFITFFDFVVVDDGWWVGDGNVIDSQWNNNLTYTSICHQLCRSKQRNDGAKILERKTSVPMYQIKLHDTWGGVEEISLQFSVGKSLRISSSFTWQFGLDCQKIKYRKEIGLRGSQELVGNSFARFLLFKPNGIYKCFTIDNQSITSEQ